MGTLASLVPGALAPGALLAGRYRLHSCVLTRRSVQVWRGTDVVLARTVAVKIPAGDETELASFRDKARLTGAVTHEGIVRVYDYIEAGTGSPPFFVTEYVDGSSLAELMTPGPMRPVLVMNICAQAARALHAAHSAGLGLSVEAARDALQRLGLVVGIVWLTTARASPGHVVTVWPTGQVPAGSSVVLVGSERSSAIEGGRTP